MRPVSSQPTKTKNTLHAIEKFSHIQLVVLGSFQLLACNFNKEITAVQISEKTVFWTS